MVRRVFKWIAVGVVSTSVAVALGLWLEHRLPLELPLPTGSFAVGRTSDRWDDNLSVWMWYPAAVAAPADDYLPDAVRARWEHDRPALINFLTRDLSKVRAHSAGDVPVSHEQPGYPVVILRGTGTELFNTGRRSRQPRLRGRRSRHYVHWQSRIMRRPK